MPERTAAAEPSARGANPRLIFRRDESREKSRKYDVQYVFEGGELAPEARSPPMPAEHVFATAGTAFLRSLYASPLPHPHCLRASLLDAAARHSAAREGES